MREPRDSAYSWELRELTMLADEANIALDMYLQGKRELSLLIQGVKFCDAIGKAMEKWVEYGGRSPFMRNAIASVLYGDESKEYLRTKGVDLSDLQKVLFEIRTILQSIIEGTDQHPLTEKIAQVQDLLFSLSMPFQEEDVANLRQLKQRRSLKAYG
ncbi:MAG: hypothetical protein HY706_05420 [Candidatus Hydrogenedentes bacterium]|nr:hypothetical protein [Candidatus Hydrogenedentota bacterium]